MLGAVPNICKERNSIDAAERGVLHVNYMAGNGSIHVLFATKDKIAAKETIYKRSR